MGHEDVRNRLVQLVNPVRHNHPGIPHDFFVGYILMVGENVDQAEQYSASYGPSPGSTVILGKLPENVLQIFQTNYGRFNQVEKFSPYFCNFL